MLTAGKDYGVRVITAYENRRVGQVFFPPALLRDALVRRKFVERVQAPPEAEQASFADTGQSESIDRLFGRQRRHLGRK